jgi:beta-phosphoglucomutase-like phosphatase (HAD superfamily)
MGTLPRDTWVFEDGLYAIKTAKNAGFRTAGVYDASNMDDLDEIKRISDIYLEKLDGFNDFFMKASSLIKQY